MRVEVKAGTAQPGTHGQRAAHKRKTREAAPRGSESRVGQAFTSNDEHGCPQTHQPRRFPRRRACRHAIQIHRHRVDAEFGTCAFLYQTRIQINFWRGESRSPQGIGIVRSEAKNVGRAVMMMIFLSAEFGAMVLFRVRGIFSIAILMIRVAQHKVPVAVFLRQTDFMPMLQRCDGTECQRGQTLNPRQICQHHRPAEQTAEDGRGWASGHGGLDIARTASENAPQVEFSEWPWAARWNYDSIPPRSIRGRGNDKWCSGEDTVTLPAGTGGHRFVRLRVSFIP